MTFNFRDVVARRGAADALAKAKPTAREPKRPAATKSDMTRRLRHARAAGFEDGRASERARVRAILAAGGLADHPAVRLAITTELSAAAAAKRLAPVPAENRLLAAARRMGKGCVR